MILECEEGKIIYIAMDSVENLPDKQFCLCYDSNLLELYDLYWPTLARETSSDTYGNITVTSVYSGMIYFSGVNKLAFPNGYAAIIKFRTKKDGKVIVTFTETINTQ